MFSWCGAFSKGCHCTQIWCRRKRLEFVGDVLKKREPTVRWVLGKVVVVWSSFVCLPSHLKHPPALFFSRLHTHHRAPAPPTTMHRSEEEETADQAQQQQPEGRRVSIAASNPGARRVSYADDRAPRGSLSEEGNWESQEGGGRRRSSALNVRWFYLRAGRGRVAGYFLGALPLLVAEIAAIIYDRIHASIRRGLTTPFLPFSASS